MARIRSIKPEVRRSLTVAQWSREVRLAWIYLWGYLDDEGRGVDDMRLAVAELFPLDRDVTEKKLDKWLDIIATTKTNEDDSPPLCRYEVAGQRYLHAVKWADHQRINRPSPSRVPPCPAHEYGVSDSRNHSRSDSVSDSRPDSRASRAPAEQGKEGSREQGTRSAADAASATVNQRANTLATHYTDRVPLSKHQAVAALLRRAINSELYTDQAIATALDRLIDAQRPVTADTLRIELEGTPRRNGRDESWVTAVGGGDT